MQGSFRKTLLKSRNPQQSLFYGVILEWTYWASFTDTPCNESYPQKKDKEDGIQVVLKFAYTIVGKGRRNWKGLSK